MVGLGPLPESFLRMRICAALLLVLGLAGCSSSADVNFVNGQPFLMGDSQCARYRSVSAGVVQCLTSSNQPTEQRRALTGQELQFLMVRRQQQSQELAALGQSMQQAGASFNQGAQANLYNASQYQAPQVQNFTPQGNAIVNCFQTGPITHCR
jgi:hypothetical protein